MGHGGRSVPAGGPSPRPSMLSLRRVPTSSLLLLLLGFSVLSLVIIESTLSSRHHKYSKAVIRVGEGKKTTLRPKKEEMEGRMSYRKAKLKEACRRHGLDRPGNDSLHRPNPWEFLVNKKYKLVWCNVFKAASTSWMYNFNILAGYRANFLKRTKVVPLQLARRRYPRPSLHELREALNTSYSFLIVRHPFERLLSAYRDKIQYALPNTPHHKLANQIVLKYRNPAYDGGGRRKSMKTPRWPSLSEFVNYLVDTRKKHQTMDMHWVPITEFCTPCQINFDIIIKFETLQEDQNYLIQLAGLEGKIKAEWKNPSKGRVTGDLLHSYFSQLTPTQISQLYNLYRYDFELFGYSIREYMEMAGKEKRNTKQPNL